MEIGLWITGHRYESVIAISLDFINFFAWFCSHDCFVLMLAVQCTCC